jgi:hypothetical protein
MLALLPTAVQTHVRLRRLRNEIEEVSGPYSIALEAMRLEMKSHWECLSDLDRELYDTYLRQHMLAA